MAQALKRTKGYLSCHRVSFLAVVPIELIHFSGISQYENVREVCQGINEMARMRPFNSAATKVFNCIEEIFVCH